MSPRVAKVCLILQSCIDPLLKAASNIQPIGKDCGVGPQNS